MRVEFDGEPHLRPTGAADQWILDAPWSVKVWRTKTSDVEVITIPAGFVTDLASVPRLPGAYMLFGGRARRSAIVHDFLYETQAGKDFADDVFHAAMKAEGMNWFTRSAMFTAVHLFGGPIYDGKPAALPNTVPAELGE
jgi:hypothetical protein